MPGPDARHKVLGIVPARGGSRGVIRKNLRGVAGLHLLARTVKAAVDASVFDQIIVSSNDAEILGWAESRGIDVHRRSPNLAGPEVTIAETAQAVVHDLNFSGIVVVLQPTVPLRMPQTIRDCINRLLEVGARSLATVTREKHLMWRSRSTDLSDATPLFSARVNRQFNDDVIVRETGSVQIIYSDELRHSADMVSDHHILFETKAGESDDVDHVEDLRKVADRIHRGTVVLRLTANRSVGSGHLHHCLQLAEHLDHHNLVFLLRNCDDFAVEFLERSGWTFRTENSLASDLEMIADAGPRLLVNDVLDTHLADVAVPMELGWRVVNIEDRGPGARLADLVVNALYAPDPAGPNHVLNGPRFATLRTEFMNCPEKQIRETARSILITFGGTDPNNLAERTFRAIYGKLDADIRVIQGPGARPFDVSPDSAVVSNVASMAAEMMRADIIVTAAGRTVYEAASTGTPVVVLSQHPRESSHAHLSMEDGVIHLGLGTLLSDQELLSKIRSLCDDECLRRELSVRLRGMIDHLGAERIAHRLEGILRDYE